MVVKIIASGSSGNVTYIRHNDKEILIDCGISFKNIKLGVESVGGNIDNVSHCFITHEHIDHIKGLNLLLKKTNAFICLTKKTYKYILGHNNYKEALNHQERFIILENTKDIYVPLNIDDILITPIKTYHDASESVGYIFNTNDNKLVYLTDTGYIPESSYPKLSNADVYILECNHDPDLLMNSSRPFVLKQRILGDNGHLSNADALYALAHIIGDSTKYVFYAHISEECNELKIINDTKCQIFNKLGIDCSNISFEYALRNGAMEVVL